MTPNPPFRTEHVMAEFCAPQKCDVKALASHISGCDLIWKYGQVIPRAPQRFCGLETPVLVLSPPCFCSAGSSVGCSARSSCLLLSFGLGHWRSRGGNTSVPRLLCPAMPTVPVITPDSTSVNHTILRAPWEQGPGSTHSHTPSSGHKT